MKILHLINDHQVIERTLGVYENLFPNQNVVLLFNKTTQIKHLVRYATCTLVTTNNLKRVAKAYDFSGITYIIAHFMTMDKIDFIKYVPRNIHVCWEVYGYDLYNQFLEPNGYKITYTNPTPYLKYAFAQNYLRPLFKVALIIKGYKYQFNWQKKKQFRYICNRIDSIQYCCRYDAQYIEDFAHRHIPSYEVFNYSLSEVLGDLKDSSFSMGRHILVGNSASFSNNHLYVLKQLKRIGLSTDTHLIMPLSYGGTTKYADDVEKKYCEEFSDRVKTLRQYIPLHEYNKMFLEINSCIMSAWRQESIGTIIMCLYMGVKVFMSNKSPLYKWLVECGFKLYELESATHEMLETPLDSDIREDNRNLVLERYNEDKVAEIFMKHIH